MLAELYQPLVEKLANKFHAKLPDCVDVGDVLTSANFGLLDAIEKFEPDRGLKFETYAPRRINGAMVDELRAMDWVPRLERSRNDSPATMQSLSAEVNREGDKAMYAADVTPDPAAVRDAEQVEMRDWFHWACRGLSSREQMMVELYFSEGATMHSIGQALGISESRVSQMMSGILARLRVRMIDAGHDPAVRPVN